MALTGIFMITLLGYLVVAVIARPHPQKRTPISWTSCEELNRNITILNGAQGSIFDCAELTVPLDYTNPSSQPLQLNLFKVNATKEPVLGTVLINFGGPGQAAPPSLATYGEQLAITIGAQWNLVSWDPRGTGKTIPFDCQFQQPVGGASTGVHKREMTAPVSANLTDFFLNGGGWNFAGSLADQCYAAMNDIGRFISSASVARDMLRMVDALGEDGLLRYYGWSYGTALGSYFAAMFPDRVERMVLDANLDPSAYQVGHYGDILLDTDKTYRAFFQECLNNRDRCALARNTNATSTDDLIRDVNSLLRPLAVNASSSPGAWQTYTGPAQKIFSALYKPKTWPQTADTIAAQLNGTYVAPKTNTTIEPYNRGVHAVVGISGSDALWRTDSQAAYLPIVKYQEVISSFSFAYFNRWLSARWKIPSAEQYQGSFSNITTRHPILYVNGEYDPITPLRNAYTASRGFRGSVVISHSGYGHGSIADPSACVAEHVNAYYLDGTLPSTDPRCTPNAGPWDL